MKSAVLIDTDVFSFLLKHDSRRLQYEAHIEGKRVGISVMTLAEIRRWPLERKWGSEKRKLLDDTIAAHFIIPLDAAVAEVWASIYVKRAKAGRPINVGDCRIAATAVCYDLPLLTHNARDFELVPDLTVFSASTRQG